jgi:hypothetical protein
MDERALTECHDRFQNSRLVIKGRDRAYLGGEHLDAGVLDVPAELGHGPADAAEVVGPVRGVAEVLGAPRGAVQPQRRPQQLVAVPAHGRVVAPHLRDAAVVRALVPVAELEQLPSYVRRTGTCTQIQSDRA